MSKQRAAMVGYDNISGDSLIVDVEARNIVRDDYGRRSAMPTKFAMFSGLGVLLIVVTVAAASVAGATRAYYNGAVTDTSTVLSREFYVQSGLPTIAENLFATKGTCEETYGVLPCSTSLGGNVFLMLVYGTLLLVAAKLISDGSELLLQVLDPGIVGGLLLPVLGGFPDALLIVVSGVGGTLQEAQEQVLVGMGVLAGSTIMLLTLAWGGSLICGRCDLTGPEGTAKERTLTRGWSPSGTGVTTDEQTRMGAWIMVVSILPYFVVQVPLLDNGSSGQRKIAALIGLILSLGGLVAYCTYQVLSPWLQEKRISSARLHYMRTMALRDLQRFSADKSWGGLLLEDGVTPNRETLEKVFDQFDENGDGQLSRSELKALIVGLGIRHKGVVPTDSDVLVWLQDFDSDADDHVGKDEFVRGLGRWILGIRKLTMQNQYAKAEGRLQDVKTDFRDRPDDGVLESMTEKARGLLNQLEIEEEEEEAEEEEKEVPKTKSQIIREAVFLLIGGAVLVTIFADPMVDAITGFSTASGIPSFFVAFVVSPLASNASELVSSLLFAMKKKKRTISLTYSQVYGAITMNNTLCLGVFLLLVFIRGLVWEFSAEVSVILLSTVLVGILGGTRKTFPLWTAYCVLTLYPLSIAIVAILDYVVGWK